VKHRQGKGFTVDTKLNFDESIITAARVVVFAFHRATTWGSAGKGEALAFLAPAPVVLDSDSRYWYVNIL
jgi:hypothetical protein